MLTKLHTNITSKMKMGRIICLLSLTLISTYGMAQSINDTIFNNVLLVEKEAIVKDVDDYLIDVVINGELNKNPIVFNDSRLSNNFIINRLFKHKPIIVITPDWKYYDDIAEEATRMGGCIEPATTNIVFQRNYLDNEPSADSIRISGKQPKLVFTQSLKDLRLANNIIFYHEESFGSTCCERDPKWDMKKRLDEFMRSFEIENNIKLGAIYKKITGKEGEHSLYFTLSNLNKKQKLKFLKDIRYWHFENQEPKDMVFPAQIFTANSIRKDGLKLIME